MANPSHINYQPFLDDFEEALKEQDVRPEVRTNLVAQFEAAMQEAEQNPTSAALTLAHWKDTVATMSQFFEQGDTSATEQSDLMRRFDGITSGLERLRDREAADPATTPGEPTVETQLPKGPPADLAAKLGQPKP